MEGSLEHFLDHLTLAARSEHTLAAYRRDLSELTALLKEQDLENASADALGLALRTLRQRGLNSRSLARKLSAWRSFYGWLRKEGRRDDDPCLLLHAPKAAQLLPKAMPVDATAALLDRVEPEDALSTRDRALFELIYSCGLRLSEAVSLNLADVDLEEGMLRVTGKGNKTRILPVGAQAVRWLQTWQAERAAAPDEQALFVGRHGTRLGQRQVQKRLKEWAIKTGAPQHVHPHMLRHSFASHLLQSSGDLRAVQELLGHENLSSTQIYTKLDFQRLAEVYDQAHPRARKKD